MNDAQATPNRRSFGGLRLLRSLAALALTAGAVWLSVRLADRELRGQLLQQTRLVARAVNIDFIKALAGAETDRDAPAYRRLKEQLRAIVTANSNCRWFYLMGRKPDGTVFFFVDSEAPFSKDESPPGQIYQEVPESYRRVFDDKSERVVGPVTDRWGVWFSALAPLIDPKTGAVTAVLGMDVDARAWRWKVAAMAAMPVGLLMVLLIIAAAAFPSLHRTNAAPKPMLRRLLPPLAVMVILMMGCGVELLYHQHRKSMDAELAAAADDIFNNLQIVLAQQADGLAAAALPIAADAAMLAFLRDGDTNQLLHVWRPVFETLRRDHHLAHFSFSDTNRVCLLRVHNPGKRGDLIDRFTVIKAERTGKTASGIELGPLGTFTLRVVQPLFAGAKPVGYLELGKEIEDALRTLRLRSGNQLAVFVRKQHVQRQDWEEGMRLLGRDANWDRLPRSVLIFSSENNPPEAFLAWFDRWSRGPIGAELDGNVTLDGKNWRMAAMPLQDASGNEVGDLLIMCDITAEKVAYARMITMSGTAGAILLALLLGFIYRLLRRTDEDFTVQQANLLESENKYRRLVENSHDIIYTMKAEGIFIFASPSWTEVLGHPVDEVVGKSFRQFVHPEDIPACAAWLQKVVATGQRQEGIEYRVRHSNGSWRWHFSSGVPLRDQTGRVLGFEGMAYDITERKQVEEELRASRYLFGSVIDSTPSSVFAFDLQHRFILLNNAMARLCGMNKGELLGKLIDDVFPKERADALKAINRRVVATGEPLLIEEELSNNLDHQPHVMMTSRFPLRDAQGAISGIGGVATEITERKQTERQMALQVDELRRWQKVTLGREARIGELKREVNALAVRLGQTPPYATTAGVEPNEQG